MHSNVNVINTTKLYTKKNGEVVDFWYVYIYKSNHIK